MEELQIQYQYTIFSIFSSLWLLLLHSHIKRRAIIWIGCHVCLLVKSSIRERMVQSTDTKYIFLSPEFLYYKEGIWKFLSLLPCLLSRLEPTEPQVQIPKLNNEPWSSNGQFFYILSEPLVSPIVCLHYWVYYLYLCYYTHKLQPQREKKTHISFFSAKRVLQNAWNAVYDKS